MKFKILLIISFILISAKSNAESVYGCDATCNNLSNKALSVARSVTPGTKFSVIDFNNNVVKTYISEMFYSSTYPESLERAAIVSTTTNARNIFNQINSAKSTVEGSRYEIPGTIAKSAYDLVAKPQTKNLIATYIKDNTGIWDTVNDLLTIAEQKITGGAIPKFVLVIKFEDGSTAQYVMSKTSYADGFIFEYVLDSAISASGVKIPNKDTDFQGIYKFENMIEANNFGVLANLYGVMWDTQNICTAVPEVTCKMVGEKYKCVGTLQCP